MSRIPALSSIHRRSWFLTNFRSEDSYTGADSDSLGNNNSTFLQLSSEDQPALRQLNIFSGSWARIIIDPERRLNLFENLTPHASFWDIHECIANQDYIRVVPKMQTFSQILSFSL